MFRSSSGFNAVKLSPHRQVQAPTQSLGPQHVHLPNCSDATCIPLRPGKEERASGTKLSYGLFSSGASFQLWSVSLCICSWPTPCQAVHSPLCPLGAWLLCSSCRPWYPHPAQPYGRSHKPCAATTSGTPQRISCSPSPPPPPPSAGSRFSLLLPSGATILHSGRSRQLTWATAYLCG